MRIAGHSSVTTSQRYVHPTPEGLERAFERLESLNVEKFRQASAETREEEAVGSRVSTIFTTVKKGRTKTSSQVVEFKNTGP